jgi:hypothetical protein
MGFLLPWITPPARFLDTPERLFSLKSFQRCGGVAGFPKERWNRYGAIIQLLLREQSCRTFLFDDGDNSVILHIPMKKTLLSLLVAIGLIGSASAALVGITGNEVYYASIWSGNSDYIYTATFSANSQINSVWEWSMPNYLGSVTGFGNAAGVLYSEDRNSLFSYIKANNYSFNAFCYEDVRGSDNSIVWRSSTGQVRDVIQGENLTISLERQFYIGTYVSLKYYGDAPNLTVDNLAVTPTGVDPYYRYWDDFEEPLYYESYKAVVTADTLGQINISFNTGAFNLTEDHYYVYGGLNLWDQGMQPHDNILSLRVVPEPSTYALFGLGALALIVAYRRKVA